MLVNYKVRCEQDTMIDGLTCRVIRYGVTKDECNVACYPSWHDVGTNYNQRGGRTTPIENETIKHFFNKRIIIDEDYVPKTQTVHGDSDAGSVGSHDGEGSTDGTEEIEASAEGVGCGDQGTGEEEVTS